MLQVRLFWSDSNFMLCGNSSPKGGTNYPFNYLPSFISAQNILFYLLYIEAAEFRLNVLSDLISSTTLESFLFFTTQLTDSIAHCPNVYCPHVSWSRLTYPWLACLQRHIWSLQQPTNFCENWWV